jgi:hypothetical protein
VSEFQMVGALLLRRTAVRQQRLPPNQDTT